MSNILESLKKFQEDRKNLKREREDSEDDLFDGLDEEDKEEFVPAKRRRQDIIKNAVNIKQFSNKGDSMENEEEENVQNDDTKKPETSNQGPIQMPAGPNSKKSLLEATKDLSKVVAPKTSVQEQIEEEQRLMRELTESLAPLQSVKVRSQGIEFKNYLKTSWKIPNFFKIILEKDEIILKEREMEEEKLEKERQEEEIKKAQEVAIKKAEDALNAEQKVEEKEILPEPKHAHHHHVQEQKKKTVVELLRERYMIFLHGEDIDSVPPPIPSFQLMKFPKPLLQYLSEVKHIHNPTAVQIQGLPILLSGRDLIGIAYTGSGKTLVFTLPIIMRALEEEMRLPLEPGEGPIGVILAPSRELAMQTHDICKEICKYLNGKKSHENAKRTLPKIRTMLTIGGGSQSNASFFEQKKKIEKKGIHIIVATPGRLLHLLKSGVIDFSLCKCIALDEADRLVDIGFEGDIRGIFDFFGTQQKQTILFSATMPEKIQDFAKSALYKPVILNIGGRAGAANLDVIQTIEFVKQEEKMGHILEVLQKTPPPVLIFSENKSDVDDITEFLLLKCLKVVSLHGSKSQEEREDAIMKFRRDQADILVATDVCSKGLDFSNVQHVINYDMPKEIENYIHRIGRTGRCGKTGLATTFVNRNDPESILLDMKHILIEAKQKVPKFFSAIEDPMTEEDIKEGRKKGCLYCGGLGHTISNCIKFQKDMSLKRQTRLSNMETIVGDT